MAEPPAHRAVPRRLVGSCAGAWRADLGRGALLVAVTPRTTPAGASPSKYPWWTGLSSTPATVKRCFDAGAISRPQASWPPASRPRRPLCSVSKCGVKLGVSPGAYFCRHMARLSPGDLRGGSLLMRAVSKITLSQLSHLKASRPPAASAKTLAQPGLRAGTVPPAPADGTLGGPSRSFWQPAL